MTSRSKILLVDDEPGLGMMISIQLKAAGYEVTVATDGQQALDQVKLSNPDLIILDLMLPKIDGYKVCRLLKFDERYRKIPVLVSSARSQAADIQLAKECGADDYLTKPFEPQVLLKKLEELLAAARPGTTGSHPQGGGS